MCVFLSSGKRLMELQERVIGAGWRSRCFEVQHEYNGGISVCDAVNMVTGVNQRINHVQIAWPKHPLTIVLLCPL